MASTGAKTAALHTETIGSFLRPPELIKAREAFNDGDLNSFKSGRKPGDLIALEDRCIRDVVKLQEDVGLDVVTDGEFRRTSWFAGFLGAIERPDPKEAAFNFMERARPRILAALHPCRRRSAGPTDGAR